MYGICEFGMSVCGASLESEDFLAKFEIYMYNIDIYKQFDTG